MNETTNNAEALRAQFEAWANGEGLSLSRTTDAPLSGYYYDDTDAAWQAWQAALASQPQAAGAGGDAGYGEAWQAMCAAMDEVAPGLCQRLYEASPQGLSGVEQMVAAIRALAAAPAPAVEPGMMVCFDCNRPTSRFGVAPCQGCIDAGREARAAAATKVAAPAVGREAVAWWDGTTADYRIAFSKFRTKTYTIPLVRGDTPPAEARDPEQWPQWVKDAVRNANEAGRAAGRAEAREPVGVTDADVMRAIDARNVALGLHPGDAMMGMRAALQSFAAKPQTTPREPQADSDAAWKAYHEDGLYLDMPGASMSRRWFEAGFQAAQPQADARQGEARENVQKARAFLTDHVTGGVVTGAGAVECARNRLDDALGSPWRCDACGKMQSANAGCGGFPDVLCGPCYFRAYPEYTPKAAPEDTRQAQGVEACWHVKPSETQAGFVIVTAPDRSAFHFCHEPLYEAARTANQEQPND